MNKEQIQKHLHEVFLGIKNRLHNPSGINGGFFAGGVFASLVRDEEVADYDLWFRTKEEFENCSKQAEIYGVVERKSRFSHTIKLFDGKIVQLIGTRIGAPSDTISGFDFKHCQAYFCPNSGEMVCDEEFLKSKRLEYNKGSLKQHPVNTVERVLKFTRRGYFMHTSEVVQMMLDIREVDPEKIVYNGADSR